MRTMFDQRQRPRRPLTEFSQRSSSCTWGSTGAIRGKSAPGHGGVNFSGLKSRSMSDERRPFMVDSQKRFMARIGATKIPEGSRVKPWRFDLVEAPEDPLCQWYVVLIVPFSKPVYQVRARGGGAKRSRQETYRTPNHHPEVLTRHQLVRVQVVQQ